MKKLLALLGVTLLAGCQMPGYADDETMDDENMAPPMEDMAPPMEETVAPPAEESVMEEESEEPAMEEEAAVEADINVEATNEAGEAI